MKLDIWVFLLFDLVNLNALSSLDYAKKSYYRAANAIFGKIGQYASEDVTLQLINVKCVPILMYGLEACPLVKSDLSSLDFVINRFFYETI